MNTKSKISRIQKRILSEKKRFEKRKDKLTVKLDSLYEELAGFRKGDKVKVSSIRVRDHARTSDLEVLGKKGVITKVNGRWITVKLADGALYGFATDDNYLEKLH